MDIILKDIYEEDTKELKELKGDILILIAKTPIKYVDLQKMQFDLNDKLFDLKK